jgi:predicted RNA-binding protein (virulence factor B family)
MINKYENLKETVAPNVFTQGQKVEVEIYAFTNLGAKVAINDEYTGLVYGTQIYDDYQEGQKLDAYISLVREDGKIDISLQPQKAQLVSLTAEKILEHLKAAGGKSWLNDKSSPDNIRKMFQVSKLVFKQALGSLYKQHKIVITDKGISLIEK